MALVPQQPDFSKIFADYFGGKPKRVVYRLRLDSNLLHDLQFISSLVSHATVFPRRSTTRGRKFLLRMYRECWEVPAQVIDEVCHPYVADCELSVSPVHEVRWEIPHDIYLMAVEELCLHGVEIGSDYWDPARDTFSLTFRGDTWKCLVTVGKGPKVVLHDKSTPVLDTEFFDAHLAEGVLQSNDKKG